MYPIFKTLDISSAHITKETNTAISDHYEHPRDNGVPPLELEDDPLFVHDYPEYGWTITVPLSDSGVVAHLQLLGYSDLAKLLIKALELDCKYLRLDADTDNTLNGFGTYNW